ncbi:ADP-ribose glycohydrolase OARD1-like [Physella acuta]|uniref:ADP-ribose glycohydrolase OARD1-like n=1 Tax=Physella acuta TaxID=109671 RepID=UPI0027DBB724|nr:ADP-ribose glycohydrolase OARD1-like [Physella acuta]XP_059153501.1 ADP-ribose glycohydrolase OARD1-like [Physella acuta]XP_059153502.1 ADP-ribose glycohydrolase OARD1-like [Physella acuta]
MKLIEVEGDLFSCDETVSLVQCVSKDLHMGKGIAAEFKKRFGCENEAKAQKADVGEVIVLPHGHRHLFYLVTKTKYNNKPTMAQMKQCLLNLRDRCLERGVTVLAMPAIGCGLDKLIWEEVKEQIELAFGKTDIVIRVYFLPGFKPKK